jgi:hypothetical protein
VIGLFDSPDPFAPPPLWGPAVPVEPVPWIWEPPVEEDEDDQ